MPRSADHSPQRATVRRHALNIEQGQSLQTTEVLEGGGRIIRQVLVIGHVERETRHGVRERLHFYEKDAGRREKFERSAHESAYVVHMRKDIGGADERRSLVFRGAARDFGVEERADRG